MSTSSERTEEATPRRKAALLARGVRSHSVLAQATCAFLIAIGFAEMLVARTPAFAHTLQVAAAAAAGAGRVPSPAGLLAVCQRIPQEIGISGLIAALFAAVLVAAVIATAACGSLSISLQAMAPRMARLRPNVQRLVSRESLIRSFSSTFATCLLTALLLPRFTRALSEIARSSDIANQTAIAVSAVQRLWCAAITVLVPVAAVDVFVQRRRQSASAKMTPREVRDERSQTEGRPEIKQRRRGVSAKRARGLRIAAIRRATAVIANPAHVAVALRYAPPTIDVPMVVARGLDRMAIILKQAASKFEIPVIEAPELARGIYECTDIDEPIPEECYAAVAAVFSWILRVHGRLRRGDEEDG